MKKTEFETGHNSETSCSFLKGNQGNKASCTLSIGMDFKNFFVKGTQMFFHLIFGPVWLIFIYF